MGTRPAARFCAFSQGCLRCRGAGLINVRIVRRSLLSTAVGVSLAAGLAVPVLATSAAGAASCQGETATVVGVANSTVNGTEGADVIVSNGADTVNALGGDDLVCVTRTGADVDAGRGADRIEVSAVPRRPDSSSSADLGPGADRYLGWAGTDVVTDEDADVDDISTAAGRDQVTVGSPDAPLVDRVQLGTEPPGRTLPVGFDDVMGGDIEAFGYVVVKSPSMAPGASLAAAGGPAQLYLGDGAGTWRVDNKSGTAGGSGGDGLRFSGFTAFQVYAAEVRFTGTAADEYVRVGTRGGGVLRASMGGGDDIAVVTRGAERAITGGTGTDDLVTLAFADEIERAADPDAGRASLALAAQTGRVHRQSFSFLGFERHHVYASRSAVVVGSSAPDDVIAGSCVLTMTGGDGQDRLTVQDPVFDFYDEGGCGTTETPARVDGGRLGDILVTYRDAVLRGGTGPDQLLGYEGYTGYGDDGVDVLRGSDDTDLLHGGPGDDDIEGDAGHDRLWGDADHDRLIGGTGADTAFGSRGRDLCRTEYQYGCER